MVENILSRLEPAQVVQEPFPYVHAPEALDPAYYDELAEAFPSMERIAGSAQLANNRAYRLPASMALGDPRMPAIWRRFLDYHCSTEYLRELVRFWSGAIAREYPWLESAIGKPLTELTAAMRRYVPGGAAQYMRENLYVDVMMDCQLVINSPVHEPSSVRGPHLDMPYTLIAALLYFRARGDRSSGGDLEFYRLRRPTGRFDARYRIAPEAVEPFYKVDYRPDTLVMWLNTPNAIHGVTPRSVTEAPRRYVNFVADCYALGTDTLFDAPRTPGGTVKGWFQHAIRKQLLRRTVGLRPGSRANP
jgi:hypothetical protein